MISELTPYLTATKLKGLLSEISHRDAKPALAAEAELLVLWAVSGVAHLNPEPVLPHSSSRPDGASDDLFKSAPAILEVTALSDDRFSEKEGMDRTANIIANFANQLRKGAGQQLFFEFFERQYWERSFRRERCVDPNFQLTPEVRDRLSAWIKAPDWPNPESIRLEARENRCFDQLAESHRPALPHVHPHATSRL